MIFPAYLFADKTGWLDPDGKFMPCKTYEHISEAEKFVSEYGYIQDIRYPFAYDETLLRNGWVKISISFIHSPTWEIYWSRSKLSRDQRTFLSTYFAENSNIEASKSSRMCWDLDDDHY